VTSWTPDILGAGWERTTFALGHDEEGPLVATLVRAPRAQLAHEVSPRPAVLYVHGFNDYFFQTHLAEQWLRHGYDFYALDLRKCGRSMRSWQTPHYCTDLLEYATELTRAARLIRGELGHPTLVVMGHSTGGLITSLWANSVRDERVVDALVLNSPFFDLNAPWFQRVVSARVLGAVAPVQPKRVVTHGLSAYSQRLHVSHGGRWDYDLRLKPPEGFPVRAGWLRAVRRAQAQLARGFAITAPILVCTAQASGPNRLDNPHLDQQDTVLDIRQISDVAHRLGPHVTGVRIPGGIHDLSLSAERPRELFFETIFGWLSTNVLV